MGLLNRKDGGQYAPLVAHPKTAAGPWGEAIKYWLPRRNMRQADLARATEIDPKSISSMARGFHTTTNQLARVAVALRVPLEDVLVSPARRQADEYLERRIREAVSFALRAVAMERPGSYEAAQTSFNDHVREETHGTEQQRHEEPPPIQKSKRGRKKGRR